ncbi:HDOD domain-containing protein [bacterium]|nr:HDOD domain-containing protein [bacterium]
MSFNIEISEKDLPVLSAVANKALALMQNDNVSNNQLDNLIKQDPALTQRVLHVANTPFYCGGVGSRTISSAIMRLGLRQLRNVILMAASGELFNANDPIAQGMWEHSIASAMAGQILADQLRVSGTDEAFVAAMLHDVGKVIIYRQAPNEYRELHEQASAGGERIQAAEDKLFVYFNHSTVGALTIRKWKLSDSVAEAVRFHHDLETVLPKLENENLASIVSLANIFANNLGYGRPICEWPAVGKMACAMHLRLTPERIQTLVAKVQGAIETQLPKAAV